MAIQSDSMDMAGKRIALAVFIALVVDGMDIQMLALALSNISKDMKISPVLAGALGTFTLVGMGVGGILAGWLSDRFGRIKVTCWATLIFSVLTAMIGLCQTYWQIAVMRFLSGFGLAALYSVGTLLAAEYVPTKIRAVVLGTLQAGYSVGYVIAALLASYLIPAFGWRSLFFCAIVPGIISILLFHGMSDPPSWFAARQAVKNKGRERNEFALIWSDKSTRRTFLLWCLTAIFFQFSYFGANTWLPSYLVKDLGVNLKNMGWYVAATYSMMVVGKILTGYLADMFGRRLMWAVSAIITAVYLPLLIYVASIGNIAYLLLIFGFIYGAPYAINATYLSESFPGRSAAQPLRLSMPRGGLDRGHRR